MDRVEIDVLGPVQVRVSGTSRMVGGHNAQSVLVTLVLAAGRWVPAEGLADQVWKDNPPPTAGDTLQSVVSRLRRVLGAGVILSDGHNYRLDPARTSLDITRFEAYVRAADECLPDDPKRARRLVTDALTLWRGEPFGELCDDDYVLPEVVRLDELRRLAMEIHIKADISEGRYAAAIGRLTGLIDDDPWHEGHWYLIMVALARAGRRREALERLEALRDVLAEAGLEPSSQVIELATEIVRDDPAVRPHLAERDGLIYRAVRRSESASPRGDRADRGSRTVP